MVVISSIKRLPGILTFSGLSILALNSLVFIALHLAMALGMTQPDFTPLMPGHPTSSLTLMSMFTYMFVHFDSFHLICNMALLLVCARMAYSVTHIPVWMLYLAGGFAGAAAYLVAVSYGTLCGASAAVLCVATTALFAKGRGVLKAVIVVAMLICIAGAPLSAGGSAAHLAGIACGLCAALIFKRRSGSTGIGTSSDLHSIAERIKTTGFESLSATERAELNNLSDFKNQTDYV